MAYEAITFEKQGPIAIITLNRPQKLNALSGQLLSEVGQAIQDTWGDDAVRAVIITGNGRAFCAGADISEFKPGGSAESFNVFNLVEDLPKPTIAALNGMAFGGGCELAMCCDFRIAAAGARFGQPEINLGLIPGAGGTQRLPRLVGATKAKELVYTGEPINDEEAYRIGLINKIVPAEQLMDEAKALANKLAQKAPIALAVAKECINIGSEVDLHSGLALEQRDFRYLLTTEDFKEGQAAFLEKRPAAFKGR